MAVYKVIQDIEAEDKIIGWLSLKGLIYAFIAGGLAFICVRLAISGLGDAKWAFIIILLPPLLLFGILAAPIGKDQPTEVWILSHVQFFLAGHKKVWDQSGVAELVTITAPKKIEKLLTKDFSQDEVRNRLKALAATLDSRGWAVRNVTTDIYGQPGYFMGGAGDSDRLIGASAVAQPQQVLDVHDSDDILDETSNATAQKFSQLMQDADAKRKKAMLEMFEAAKQGKSFQPSQSVDYRFLDKETVPTPGTSGSTFVGTNITVPETNPATNYHLPTTLSVTLGDPSLRDRHPHFETKPSLAEEQAAAAARSQPKPSTQDQTTAQQPVETSQKPPVSSGQPPADVTSADNPASQSVKMELSKSDDLSVASVAQLANHHETVRQISANEVEISLH